MATSEKLIKYYDCLKDSFNKIQDKDNKTALINAALRPKIKEEFDKSQEVLFSYLNYIQVFSLVYTDKFSSICNTILVPLFKEVKLTPDKSNESETATITENNNNIESSNSSKIHQTIQTIISSRPDLAADFVHSVIKLFPKISEESQHEAFLTFLENCLRICTYLDEENLVALVSKILDKLNPPKSKKRTPEELEQIKIILTSSYELIYGFTSELEANQLETLVTSITDVFVRDLVFNDTENQFKYLLLYLYSIDTKFVDYLLSQLWNTFLNSTRPIGERHACINFASSFISRANYINLEQLFKYLETASKWCHDFIEEHLNRKKFGYDVSSEMESTFCELSQSIFYIITQRYREMYEEETIARLTSLKLDEIIDCPLKPLQVCHQDIEQRFREVISLYCFVKIDYPVDDREQPKKRRKSDKHIARSSWKPAFKEDCDSLPEKVESLYRRYFHHRYFTITRAN